MEPSRCNRCGAWVYDGAPLCPNCFKRHNEVYNHFIHKNEVKTNKELPKSLKFLFRLFIGLIILFVLYLSINGIMTQSLDTGSFPPNAQLFEYDVELFSTEKLSLLELSTDQNMAFFVKIIDETNNNVILSVFLYPNETFKTTLPEGQYRFEYAMGKKWENILTYFGKDTKFLRKLNSFSFTQSNGYFIKLSNNLKADDLIELSFAEFD